MTPVPAGFRLRPDPGVQRHDAGRLLIGGSPRRVLRLTPPGAEVAARLLDGHPVDDRAGALLARRLLDTGIAHPLPSYERAMSVEVVVPVHEDVDSLEACLMALGSELPVTVVDDGSADAARIAAVVTRHDARLIRRDTNGGPAAARNTGVRECRADVVAFVDSDAVVRASTLRRLAAHLTDPMVAAAAPRVRSADAGGGLLGVVGAYWSPLDLGGRAGLVAPSQRVAYVPSTVVVVRRQALLDCGGFDESMRYGEDVDLFWRLGAAGLTVRYDPSLQVRHNEPQEWRSWLRRRFNYGTSAAGLMQRHGDSAAPLMIPPAPAASLAAALCGAPAVGAAIAVASAWRLHARLRDASVPTADATRAALVAPAAAALGTARWAGQLWWPLVAAAGRSRRRRAVAAAVLVAPAVVEWAKRRPPVDPVRWTMAVWADDAAYGLGVWAGCLRARTMRPLLPRVRRRSTH